jgi:hypothetical protein
MTPRLKVLVACEFSGIVREAFNRLGHDATSCDLLATEIPGDHIRHDAIDVLESEDWDMVIAHPPCTYLTNSGVRWLYGKKGGSTTRDPIRWQQMLDGCQFFARLYHSEAPRVAVENPVMHGHAVAELVRLGVPSFSQSVQPYQFGHLETKRTCLWLRGLAPLVGTEDVEKEMRALPKSQTNLVHLASPGPDRWLMRSRTYPGIAEAMAHQWGGRVTSKSFPVLKPDALSPDLSGTTPAPLTLGTPVSSNPNHKNK